jgi:ribosomal protein S8
MINNYSDAIFNIFELVKEKIKENIFFVSILLSKRCMDVLVDYLKECCYIKDFKYNGDEERGWLIINIQESECIVNSKCIKQECGEIENG